MSQDSLPNVVRVAIQRPLYKLLDYSCDFDIQPEPGCRVKVSLGNSIITAIVVETGVESEFKSLKPILELIDQAPLIDEQLLGLLHWSSNYYFHPLGEVLFHALPVDLRKGKSVPKIEIWKHTQKGLDVPEGGLKRAPKQQSMLDYLIQNNEAGANNLKQLLGDNWRSTSRELIKKELVSIEEIDPEKAIISNQNTFSVNPPHQLTDEQKQYQHSSVFVDLFQPFSR